MDASEGVQPDEGCCERIVLSVVIPLYNEEESLHGLYNALQDALRGMREPWEVLLIDDGSSDGSFRILKTLHERDRRFRIIRFRRNFGQTAAMAAGFDHARGIHRGHDGCRPAERPPRYPHAPGHDGGRGP